MATPVTEAPPTWDELQADPRFTALSGGDKLDILDRWNADVQQHLGDGYDQERADPFLNQQRAKIASEGQSPISTAARSVVTGMNEVVTGAVQGVGGLMQDATNAINQFSGVPGMGQAIIDPIPGARLARAAAPFAQSVAEESQRFYAPDSRLNPMSATIGSGLGQAVGMVPSLIAGPAGPLVLGGAAGYSQGRDTAMDLGVQNPLGRMALGAGFGATELLTERLGGIGSGPLKQGAADMLNRVAGRSLQTIASEAIEEPITGIAQDAMALGAGYLAGAPEAKLAPLSPMSPEYWNRRGMEALGGAAGGAFFAGVGKLAGRPGAEMAPMQTGNAQIDQVNAVLRASGPSAELPMGNEGASDEDFNSFEQTFASVNERNIPADATGLIVGEAQDVAGSTPAAGTNQTGLRPEAQSLGNQIPPAASLQPQAAVPVPSIDNIGTKFVPPQVRSVPVIPDSPLGYRDSLDFLNEMPIAIGRSGTGGELDWQETANIPKYYRPFIANEQGLPIDVVAEAAYEANLIPQPTADALMKRVQEDIGARRTYRVQGREQKAELLTREKQTVSFDKSQTKLGNKPTAMQVPFEALATGDQLTIDGEQVTVRAVESDEGGYLTKVVLEDGKKFGVQEFNPQSREGVFVDAFDPKPRLSGDPEVFSPAQAGGASPGGLTEGDEVMDYHRSDKNGSSYLHIKDAKRRWFSVRVADHSQRTSDPYNSLDLYKKSRNATHGITQEFPIEISILVDEPLSERKTKALALAALSEIDDQTRTSADEDGDDFNFDARVKHHEKWLDWANEQVARNPIAAGMVGVRDYLRDSPAKLVAARALIQKSQSTPRRERAMLGREPSKTGKGIAPPSPAAVNDNLNPAALESPARGLGRGLGAILGQPPPGAPASQRPATTSPAQAQNPPAMSQALFDQARAVTSQQPDQPVELEELFTRARNLLANDGSMELRPSDRTVIPQALAKLAAGENPQLIVNQWKEHRNQVLLGRTTAPTPFAEYAQASTDPGTPRARLLSAYAQLDRTGQGYVRIPDLVRASGLPIADVREVLIDLSDRNQAYLTPADEPRNIPAGDRSLLVVGPSGPSLYVTLPDPAALASPAQSTAQDAAYMTAVEAGDMATAQRMVDEAAKAAGAGKPMPIPNAELLTAPVFWRLQHPNWSLNPDFKSSNQNDSSQEEDGLSVWSSLPELLENQSGGLADYARGKVEIIAIHGKKVGTGIDGEPVIKPTAEAARFSHPNLNDYLRSDTLYSAREMAENVSDLESIDEFIDEPWGWTRIEELPMKFDPVTRDDSGRIIPLSERFNEDSDNILYSPPTVSNRTVYKRNTALNKAELARLGLPTDTGKSVQGQKPVKEALSRIAKDMRLPTTVRRMAKELQNADLSGLFFQVVADGRKEYTGLYQPLRGGQGELVVNLRHLGRGNVDPALNMAETLVHEVLHHATYRALRYPKNDVQRAAIGNLEQLRRRVKAVLGSQQMADFGYQTKNIDEFIAALFTQKPFQDALAAIPAEATPKTLVQQVRTMLDEAFRLLAEIVTGKKVPPGSVLDAAFQNALRLVEDGVRVAGTEKVGAPLASMAGPNAQLSGEAQALASPAQPNGQVPSQAVPLKPEFGGAFPGHTPYQAKERQAWAAQEIATLSAEQLAQRVEAGQYGPVDKPFVLAAGMQRAERQVRTATTKAVQTVAQTEVNRLRKLLNPQNSLAGQTLVAQRDALGEMRDRVPGLAVDEAVEKAQVQTIDAAIPVQPTVTGLADLTTQASTEATETVGGMLEAEALGLEEADSTPQEQAAGEAVQSDLEAEVLRLKQMQTAERNQFSRLTTKLQKILATLQAFAGNKGAVIAGVKARLAARRAARANTVAANKLQSLSSPAQGITAPTLPDTALDDGLEVLLTQGIQIDDWKAAMTKKLGPKYASQLTDLYEQAVDLYQAELTAAHAEVEKRVKEKKAKQKPTTRPQPQRKPLAQSFPDLAKMLRKLGPAISGLNWRQIMTSTATAQRQWELDTYAQIRQHPRLSALSPEQAKQLTRELSNAWQRERRKVWKRELDKTLIAAGMAKPKHRAKIEASAPRLLSLINLGALNAATFRDAVAKEFGLKSMTDADVLRVKALAEDLQNTPKGVPYRQNAQAFIDGLQDLTKLTRMEILQSYWTAMVLSGWRTQVDIGLGLLNGLEDVGLSGLGRTLRTAKPRVAGEALLGFLGNMPQALGEAMHHVLTGNRSLMKNYDAQVLGALEDGQKTIGSSARALRQRGGWRLVPGWGMEGVARMMTALGHITTSSTYEGAKWLAIANHPDLYLKAQQISAADRAAVKQQARQVLTGGVEPVTMADKLAERRYTMELLDEKFGNPEVLGEAQTFANETALEGDPTGLGMLFMQAVNALTVTAPAMAIKAAEEAKWHKAILWLLRAGAVWAKPLTGTKFARTLSHALNRNMTYVPGVGAIRFGMDAKWGTPKGDLVLAKQMVGLLFCAAFKMWWLGDDEEDRKQGKPQQRGIEGGWENLTAEQKSQNYAAGKKPWHLWELDKNGKIRTVNYQNWGISSLMAALGQMQDRERYQGVTDHTSLIMSGIWTGMFAWMDKAQLQSLQILTGRDSPYSTSEPELASLKKVNKFAATLVGGAFPRLGKDIDAMIDPSLRKTDEWWQVWARELPVARSLSSGKRHDIFGQDIKLDRGPLSRVYQEVTLPMEYKVLGALNERGVTLPDPSFHPRKVPMVNAPARDMTTPERDRYQRITAELYRAYIADPTPQPRYLKQPDGRYEQATLTNAQYLLKLPPEDAQEAISKATKTMRAQAVLQATKR